MILYTLNIYEKNLEKIEMMIRSLYRIKFIGYDQYELKVSFEDKLSEEDEYKLFEILDKSDIKLN